MLDVYSGESSRRKKDHGHLRRRHWVTYGGSGSRFSQSACETRLQRLCSVIFTREDIQSYRDLPKVYNQCVPRCAGRRRRDHPAFPRVLMAEGHTAHATAEGRAGKPSRNSKCRFPEVLAMRWLSAARRPLDKEKLPEQATPHDRGADARQGTSSPVERA